MAYKGKISVCMATYNGEKYIKEQIDSILSQLGKDDELIISDDGSSDTTIEIIKSYSDERIKFYSNNSHNYTKNFENAIRKASGEYIFLSDQDDVWAENKVSKVMNTFEKCNADLIVTDGYIVNEKLDIKYKSYFELLNVKRGYINNLLATRYIGASMAFKRKILKRLLPIPDNKYIAHDYWIACLCERYYKVVLLKEPLIYYRRHEGVTSPGITNKSKLGLGEKIIKRIYASKFVFSRKKI